MADERIRIIVEQHGVTEALTNLQDLKKAISDVNNQKATVSTTSTLRSQLEGAARGASQLAHGLASAFDMSGNMAHKIGSAFTDMSKLFETNFIDVVERRMAYMFVDVLTGHLSDALKRADILNTFVPYMNLAGVSTDVAQEALNRVDLSIRGLPIGLDEAAQRLRRYQMFLGDTQRATDLTIGIQKAITAGGAPQSFKNMAYYMIDRLLTAGTLSTSRQWYSLINGLGVSVRFLAEAMGLGELSAAEFAAGLANGTYSVEQFLDAVVALGNGTASSAAKLDEALGIYKSTFESWMSNIGFAATRGTANVINAISEVLESNTGKKLTGYMEEVRDGINAMFSGIVEWVKANPDAIVRVVDSVRNLFGTIGGMGFGGIARQVLENMARLFDYISRVIERLSGTNFGEFIAFATTLAGPIGSFMAKAASSLPIILGVFQRFKDFDFETLLDKIMIQVGAMATLIERVLRIIPDGMLGDLMAFALVWGKPLANVIKGIGSAIGTLTSFISGLKSVLTFLATNPIGWIIDIFAVLAGAAVYAKAKWEEMRSVVRDRLSEFADFTDEMNAATSVAKSNTDSARSNMEALKEQSKETKDLVAELLKLNDLETDSIIGSANAADRMTQIINQLNAIYPEWGLAIDESTGKLTANSIAILENVDAMLAAAQVEAAQSALTTAYTDRYTLRANKRIQEENLERLKGEKEVYDRAYEREYQRLLESDPSYYNGIANALPSFREKRLRTMADNYEFENGVTLGAYRAEYQAQIDAAEAALAETNKQLEANDLLVTSFESIVRNESDTAKSFEDLGLAAGNAAPEIDAATDSLNNHVVALEEAKEKYQELKQAARDAIDSVLGGWGEFEPPEPMTAEEMSGGVGSRKEYRESYEKNLTELLGIVRSSGNLDYYNYFQELWKNGIESAPEVAAAVEAYHNGTLNALVEAWAADQLAQDQLAKREAVIQMLVANDIEALEEAYEQDAIKKQEEADRAMKENRADRLRAPILEADAKRKAAIKALFEGLGEERAQAILDLEEQNKDIQESNDTAVAQVEESAEKMADAYEDGKMRIEEASENIIDAVNNIGAEIRSATDNNIVPSTIYMFDSMINAVYNRGSALSRAFRDVLNNITAIMQQLYSLNPLGLITGTTPSGPSPHSTSSHWGKGHSRGGIIYAANGMFIPIGTDTVPAMLTPGEFVVNKKATQTIGAHVLQQINSLDIPGALRSLMHRVPSLGGAPIINNTSNRDNHASVTQNFFNSGDDGFAYRRANRFVRALV